MSVIGNDGGIHPRSRGNERVEFLPTHNVYSIGDVKKDLFKRENWEKLMLELGSMGMDGWLVTGWSQSLDDPDCFTVIFAKTGMRVPTESPIKLV